jgi:hypothetical protein
LAVIGFNPSFWDMKDDVMSDIPFLFFAYLTLFAIQQAYLPGGSRRRTVLYAVLVGVLSYLSYGTRNAGIVLIPGLFLFDFIRGKRPTLIPWIATAVFAAGWYLQSLAIPGSDAYSDQFVLFPRVFLYNLHGYLDALFSIWANGYAPLLQIGLFAILLSLAVLGALARIRQGITVVEIFAVLYFILIIVWRANQGVRFLIPLTPVFILYIFTAVQVIGRLRFPRFRGVGRVLFGAVTLGVIFSYVGVYSRTDFGPMSTGVETPESIQLFDDIRQNTQPGDVFLFAKPRALALYTDRKVSGYSELEIEQYNLNYARNIGVKYVIVGPGDEYLRLLVKRYKAQFELVYSNSDFSMYRFLAP